VREETVVISKVLPQGRVVHINAIAVRHVYTQSTQGVLTARLLAERQR
jgi:hypothetical protein